MSRYSSFQNTSVPPTQEHKEATTSWLKAHKVQYPSSLSSPPVAWLSTLARILSSLPLEHTEHAAASQSYFCIWTFALAVSSCWGPLAGWPGSLLPYLLKDSAQEYYLVSFPKAAALTEHSSAYGPSLASPFFVFLNTHKNALKPTGGLLCPFPSLISRLEPDRYGFVE